MNKNETISIHACMLIINGQGVLITGRSSIGKSDLTLNLLDRGHQLISDDTVELSKKNDMLIASAPALLANKLCVHGLGAIDSTMHFGNKSIATESPVDLSIRLVRTNDNDNPLKPQYHIRKQLGVGIGEYTLATKDYNNLALIVECLAKEHQIQKMGIDAAQALIKAHAKQMEAKNAA